MKKETMIDSDLGATYRVIPGNAYPLGIYADGNNIHVSAVYQGKTNCGICGFRKSDGRGEIMLFDDSCRTGNVFSVVILDVAGQYDSYLLYEDGKLFPDPYAKRILGLERFGKAIPKETLRCRSIPLPFDWSGDLRPQIPYEDSFIYCLHVRGFTKRSSSGVKPAHRGTFSGLVDKIPYLKSIGVTTVELLPIYEIESVVSENDGKDYLFSENGTLRTERAPVEKINYWGFQDGYYFAPRASYCTDPTRARLECKEMIRAFHENGMEVILQFYFHPGTSKNLMIDCIRYWVSEYHIDGIHLKSDNIPVDMISMDPMLSDIKIIAPDVIGATLANGGGEGRMLNLADMDDVFPVIARRFLKSDDNTIQDFAGVLQKKSEDRGRVNYICNYYGFTLRDLVTYEHKHNEKNGEGNTDGSDDNYSWNCGVEGPSRKKAIDRLRRRQMMNALSMVLLAQGTPFLFAGDEMGNTQDGNNNPYCQDNRLAWTDWDTKGRYGDITSYLRFLTALRKKYRLLRKKEPFRLMDYDAKGYPDLSYHGTDAWQPDFSGGSHAFGMMYCGLYDDRDPEHTFIFVSFNMFWKEIKIALPSLPKGMKWMLMSDTSLEAPVIENPVPVKSAGQKAGARSVQIYIGKK